MFTKIICEFIFSIVIAVTVIVQIGFAQSNPSVYNTLRQEVVKKAGIKDETQYSALATTEKQSIILYVDGLGRKLAQVGVQANPYKQDMVSFVDYDKLSRVQTAYLPYVTNRTDGWFKGHSETVTEVTNFYNNATDKVADDASPFTVPVYDASPLSYLKEQGAPGAAWQPGQHTAKKTFRLNSASEIRIWKTDLSSTAYYGANELVIDETTDENGNIVKVILDKEGKLVEKHVQVGATEWLKTLYIYDERGQVYCILQPEGVRLLGTGTSISSGISDYHAFFFTYDMEGRIVEKKEPGVTAPNYYCYDPLGRLSLMQDGHLRAQNQWLYIKYDRLNRPLMSGIYTNTQYTTRATVQQNLLDVLSYLTGETFYEKKQNGGTLGYTNQSFPTTNTEVLSATYYDDYDLDVSGTDDYAYTTQSLTVSTPEGTLSEGTQFKTVGRVTAAKTKVLGTSNWLVSYIFYDQFGRAIQTRSNNHLSLTADNLITSLYDFTGKVWLIKKYHNAGSGKVTTVINRYEYDHAGRLRRVFQKNNSDAEEQLASYRYNELGQVVAKNLHCLDCPEDDPVSDGGYLYGDEITKYTYVPGETEYIARNNIYLKPSAFTVTGGATLKARIDAAKVEELSSTRYLQSVDYRYNIRGWITSINNAQLTNDQTVNDDDNDLFGMELLYNTSESGLNSGTGEQFWNGNIAAVKWKGPTPETGSLGQRSYKFSYDKADRLLQAAYGVKTVTNWTGEANAQNEVLTYDHNGNIKTLQRNERKWEWIGALPEYTSQTIDNLTYTFANNSNQLTKVEDAITGTTGEAGFKNGTNQTTEYTYTANGSLTADKNKGIDSVHYSVLGKPSRIKFTDGRVLTYVYAASGNKLTMKSWQGTTLVKTTHYVDGFVYENDTLQFFGSPEGRVVNKITSLEYQYAITDHQGNTRVVFSSVTPAAEVPQTNFESSSNSEFINYVNRNGMSEMNHTPSGTYSQLLHGGYSSQVGAAKTVKVYPGDTIKVEVYAKYRNQTSTTSNLLGFAAALTSVFGVSSGSTGEALNAYNSLNDFGSFAAGGDREDDDTSPKGFVTILLFDKYHNFLDAAWDQIDDAYVQTGVLDNDPFDLLAQQMTVTEEGYAYIFVSNENPTQVDIHFDDLKVTHSKTNVIQYNEYYPFGLQTSNSWTREGNNNDFLYNAGNELNQNSGWYETFFRGYDATLGRFLQVDPMTVKYNSLTPYNYGFNDPVLFNDPSGADPNDFFMIYERYGFDAAMNYSHYGSIYGISTSRQALAEMADVGAFTGGGGSVQYGYQNGQFGYWKDDPTTTVTTQNGEVVVHGRRSVWVAMATSTLGFITADVAVPEPTDLAWPKWAGYAVAGLTATVVLEYAGEGNENYPGPLVYTIPDPTTVPPPYNEPEPENYFPQGGNGLSWLGGVLALMSELGSNTSNTLNDIGNSINDASNEVVSFFSDVKDTTMKGIYDTNQALKSGWPK